MRIIGAAVFVAIVGSIGWFVLNPHRGEVPSASAQGGGGSGIGPTMNLETSTDLKVFFEAIDSSAVSNEFQTYLTSSWDCEFLGMEMTSSSGGGEFTYDGCAAFSKLTNWEALEWVYTKKAASGSSPSIPPDTISTTTDTNPTVPSGLSVLVSDWVSFQYLQHLASNQPSQLHGELQTKTLIEVSVEHEFSPTERVLSYWDFEDSSGVVSTKTVWSTVSGGTYGTINVN